jgi:hypothetical protein
MMPIASQIASRNATDLATSALPHAPVVPDPPPRVPRVRIVLAAFLRAWARRQAGLADRLDPRGRGVDPLAT